MGSERKQKNRIGRADTPLWLNALAIAFVAVAIGAILFMTGSATFEMSSQEPASSAVAGTVQKTPAGTQPDNAASDAVGASAEKEGADGAAEVIGDEDVPMAEGLDSPGTANATGLGLRWIVAVAAVIIVVVCALRFKRVNGSIGNMRGKFR